MKMKCSNSFYVIATILCVHSCMVTNHSAVYQNVLEKPIQGVALGRMKFIYGDMGGIFPHTLHSNGFVYKIAILALSTVANRPTTQADSLFMPYGFTMSASIDGEMPLYPKPTGLIFGKLSGVHPIRGYFSLEVANLSCGSCHGAPLYGKDGYPTKQYILGMPNTSLNLDALAHDLFKGYQNMCAWDESALNQMLLKWFPNTTQTELLGLNLFFKSLKKEIHKITITRSEPASYPIGSTGALNGIGAIKANLGLIDHRYYHPNEGAMVSIPTLANRSFRSSLLVSGNYAPMNQDFFHEMTLKDTNSIHDAALGQIATIFTIGTMGFNANAAAKATKDVQDVMLFLAKMQTPAFPAAIDTQKSELGRVLFQNHCQSCHGKYEGTATRHQLTSFPNRLISLSVIQTDSIRAQSITYNDFKELNKTPFKNRFQAKVHKGYVAPILSGLWATAPYLHNGSVPTLWHLMNPEQRPTRFYIGGHRLDYEKMGIRGELKNNIYQYPKTDTAWSRFEIYDTQKYGMSNKGHTRPFQKLTQTEKEQLIEFLKML